MQCDFLELCVHYMGTGLNKLVTKFRDNPSKSSPNISCLMVALCRALKGFTSLPETSSVRPAALRGQTGSLCADAPADGGLDIWAGCADGWPWCSSWCAVKGKQPESKATDFSDSQSISEDKLIGNPVFNQMTPWTLFALHGTWSQSFSRRRSGHDIF